MILISHRGNINGKLEDAENKPDYIDDTISMGYDIEIDIWYINKKLSLGHDQPQYEINQKWLQNRRDKLWIHCKNIGAIVYFNSMLTNQYNYFWHEKDDMTITSKNIIWAYPGKQPIKNSIAVLPELFNDDVNNCIGICSDYIEKYK